jgi:hypothetical protein
MQLAKISYKINIYIKLFKNQFAMCICLPAKQQFSQPPLTAVPLILPHAGIFKIVILDGFYFVSKYSFIKEKWQAC